MRWLIQALVSSFLTWFFIRFGQELEKDGDIFFMWFSVLGAMTGMLAVVSFVNYFYL